MEYVKLEEKEAVRNNVINVTILVIIEYSIVYNSKNAT